MAVTEDSICALLDDGSVRCWGLHAANVAAVGALTAGSTKLKSVDLGTFAG